MLYSLIYLLVGVLFAILLVSNRDCLRCNSLLRFEINFVTLSMRCSTDCLINREVEVIILLALDVNVVFGSLVIVKIYTGIIHSVSEFVLFSFWGSHVRFVLHSA